jgi:hypothetical protein
VFAFPIQQSLISIFGVGNVKPLHLSAMAVPIVLAIAFVSWRFVEAPVHHGRCRGDVDLPRQRLAVAYRIGFAILASPTIWRPSCSTRYRSRTLTPFRLNRDQRLMNALSVMIIAAFGLSIRLSGQL